MIVKIANCAWKSISISTIKPLQDNPCSQGCREAQFIITNNHRVTVTVRVNSLSCPPPTNAHHTHRDSDLAASAQAPSRRRAADLARAAAWHKLAVPGKVIEPCPAAGRSPGPADKASPVSPHGECGLAHKVSGSTPIVSCDGGIRRNAEEA